MREPGLQLGVTIVIEASWGFFGVGILPPHPTWGNMLSDALNSGLASPWGWSSCPAWRSPSLCSSSTS
jgi:ABC-type dipeptide/oligopeptide/nickel transport system permease subunit